MLPWFLCLLSTSFDDLPVKSHYSRSSIWWNPIESIREVNGYEIQEGDILVPSFAKSNLKNAIKSKKYLWKDGRIPYEFSKNFSCFEKEQILNAMKILEAKTCVKFIENENWETFIRFQKEENGCYAPIGRLTEIEGPLPVNLQSPECIKEQGIIEHELLHVIGLFHEQSRPDRDQYVTIHWCNIQPYREIDFLKGNFNEMTTFDLPYDYGSIMHYPKWAFSKNGKPTITSKISMQYSFVCSDDNDKNGGLESRNLKNRNDYKNLPSRVILSKKNKNVFPIEDAEANPDMILGQRISPSITDFEKVIKMYNCKISEESDGNAGIKFAKERKDP